MHPPLFKPHPLCEKVVEALVSCHEEHKIGKWFGACNNIKAELDWCFKKEKEARRTANTIAAKERRDEMERFLKFVEEKEAGQSRAASCDNR